jgi:hypothetical protein
MLFGLPPIYADTTDYTARAAIVQGYNTNVYQAQDDPNVPIISRHPSMYTGADGMVQMRLTGRPGDIHDFRLGGRAQHYEPLDGSYQSDDGSAYAAWVSRFATSPRTQFALGAGGTVTSVNSTHISDGTFFQIDPTVIRRTYFLTTTDGTVTYQISPVWRISQRFGLMTSGTIDAAGVQTPTGTVIVHRGLDYATPESETTLYRDFSERTTGDIRFLLRDTYTLYVLDLTQTPPANVGPQTFQIGTLQVSHTYRFSQELVNRLSVGGTIASPPQADPNQSLVLSPSFLEQMYYTRTLWYLNFRASYDYGAVSPRLGTGPGYGATVTFVGIPYGHGHWRNLSLLASASATHADIVRGVGPNSKLDLAGASAQIRYATSTWLGVTAGYDFHYARLATGDAFAPSLIRNIFYVGLSGYWSTDPAAPPLTVFQVPTAPP